MSVPKEWRRASVRDLCNLGRGRVISGEEIEQHPGIYPVFSSQSKDNGRMGSIDTFDFDGEYVTWTTDGAYAGTVFHRTGKFNCTNVCGTLAAKDDDLSLAFLAFKLSTVAKDYVSYVGNPKLMNGVMATIELTLPTPKPEQAKIAEILSTVDRAISQTEALIAKQQLLKNGLMQDLLSRGIDEHGNLRSEQTHQFKDSPLGRIPVEWECDQLLNLTSKIVDGVHHTPSYVAHGVPFVTVKNLTSSQGIEFDDLNYVTEQDHREFLKRADPKFGDVLVTKDGTLGVSRLVEQSHPEFSIFVSVALLRPNVQKLRPHMLYLFFDSGMYEQQMGELSAGSGLKHIHLEHFRRFLLSVPHVEEQDRILAQTSSLERSQKAEVVTLTKLRVLKTALMQDLLTGRKRVTTLLDKEFRSAES